MRITTYMKEQLCSDPELYTVAVGSLVLGALFGLGVAWSYKDFNPCEQYISNPHVINKSSADINLEKILECP